MADTRDNAHKAFDVALAKYSAKYPKAMECLKKDRDAMLAFYDFPAEHWTSIRTTNPIESAFATVRLRTAKMRNCGSRDTTLAMVFKLLETAQKRWNRLHGSPYVRLVVTSKFPSVGRRKDNLWLVIQKNEKQTYWLNCYRPTT